MDDRMASDIQNDCQPPSPLRVLFECDFCEGMFHSVKALRAHRYKVHGIESYAEVMVEVEHVDCQMDTIHPMGYVQSDEDEVLKVETSTVEEPTDSNGHLNSSSGNTTHSKNMKRKIKRGKALINRKLKAPVNKGESKCCQKKISDTIVDVIQTEADDFNMTVDIVDDQHMPVDEQSTISAISDVSKQYLCNDVPAETTEPEGEQEPSTLSTDNDEHLPYNPDLKVHTVNSANKQHSQAPKLDAHTADNCVESRNCHEQDARTHCDSLQVQDERGTDIQVGCVENVWRNKCVPRGIEDNIRIAKVHLISSPGHHTRKTKTKESLKKNLYKSPYKRLISQDCSIQNNTTIGPTDLVGDDSSSSMKPNSSTNTLSAESWTPDRPKIPKVRLRRMNKSENYEVQLFDMACDNTDNAPQDISPATNSNMDMNDHDGIELSVPQSKTVNVDQTMNTCGTATPIHQTVDIRDTGEDLRGTKQDILLQSTEEQVHAENCGMHSMLALCKKLVVKLVDINKVSHKNHLYTQTENSEIVNTALDNKLQGKPQKCQRISATDTCNRGNTIWRNGPISQKNTTVHLMEKEHPHGQDFFFDANTQLVDQPACALTKTSEPSSGPLTETSEPSSGPLMETSEPSSGPLMETSEPSSGPLMETSEPSSGPLTETTEPSSGPLTETNEPSSGPLTKTTELSSGALTETTEPSSGALTETSEPSSGALTKTTEPSSGPLTETSEPSSGPLTETTEPSSGPLAKTTEPSSGPESSSGALTKTTGPSSAVTKRSKPSSSALTKTTEPASSALSKTTEPSSSDLSKTTEQSSSALKNDFEPSPRSRTRKYKRPCKEVSRLNQRDQGEQQPGVVNSHPTVECGMTDLDMSQDAAGVTKKTLICHFCGKKYKSHYHFVMHESRHTANTQHAPMSETCPVAAKKRLLVSGLGTLQSEHTHSDKKSFRKHWMKDRNVNQQSISKVTAQALDVYEFHDSVDEDFSEDITKRPISANTKQKPKLSRAEDRCAFKANRNPKSSKMRKKFKSKVNTRKCHPDTNDKKLEFVPKTEPGTLPSAAAAAAADTSSNNSSQENTRHVRDPVPLTPRKRRRNKLFNHRTKRKYEKKRKYSCAPVQSNMEPKDRKVKKVGTEENKLSVQTDITNRASGSLSEPNQPGTDTDGKAEGHLHEEEHCLDISCPKSNNPTDIQNSCSTGTNLSGGAKQLAVPAAGTDDNDEDIGYHSSGSCEPGTDEPNQVCTKCAKMSSSKNVTTSPTCAFKPMSTENNVSKPVIQLPKSRHTPVEVLAPSLKIEAELSSPTENMEHPPKNQSENLMLEMPAAKEKVSIPPGKERSFMDVLLEPADSSFVSKSPLSSQVKLQPESDNQTKLCVKTEDCTNLCTTQTSVPESAKVTPALSERSFLDSFLPSHYESTENNSSLTNVHLANQDNSVHVKQERMSEDAVNNFAEKLSKFKLNIQKVKKSVNIDHVEETFDDNVVEPNVKATRTGSCLHMPIRCDSGIYECTANTDMDYVTCEQS